MNLFWIKVLLRIYVPVTLIGLACAGVRTTACGGNPADVMFVLDSSSSIWRPDFHRQLTFVQEMVDIFPIAPNQTRVALVTYDSHPRVIFHLNTFRVKARLRKRIGMVVRDAHMHTFTDRAIRLMRKMARTQRYGARPNEEDVTQVAIIITDGRSDNTTLTALEALKAREQGIHMFAIGVGAYVDVRELELIASEPTDEYVHRVHNYEGLNSIKELLAIQTCTVTARPSTRSTTSAMPPTTTTTTTTSTTTTTRIPTTPTPTTTTPTPTTTTTEPTTRTTTTPIPTTTTRRTTTTSTTTTSTTSRPSTTTSRSTTSTRMANNGRVSTNRPYGSTAPTYDINNQPVKRISPPPSTTPTQPPLFVPIGVGEFDLTDENEIDPNPSTTTRSPPNLLKPPFDPEGLNQICVFDEPTDIVFVVDEKEGGPDTMNNIWKFIKDLLHYVDMSNGNVNVKFIYECVDIPDVQLGSYRNKTALMSALNRLAKHPRTTADLLQHMSYRLLGSDINAIEPHHKVGVYITDGASGNLTATLNEAQTAKLLHNIELFGVGIGKDIDPTELRALVSCEVDKHLHMVIKPQDLEDVVHPVIRELCKVRKHHNRHIGI